MDTIKNDFIEKVRAHDQNDSKYPTFCPLMETKKYNYLANLSPDLKGGRGVYVKEWTDEC